MAWFNTCNTNSIPQWKLFMSQLQLQKQKCNINISSSSLSLLQPLSLPSINLSIFLPRVSMILSQLKSYNNQLTQFIRNNLYLLIKQSIRIILELPSIQSIQNNNNDNDRKNKQPIQGLEFIQGLVLLPNIFTINYLNQDIYRFYCKSIFYYMRKNVQDVNRLKYNNNMNNINNNINNNNINNNNINNNITNTNTSYSNRYKVIQQLNNSLYKNYFNRLFQIPYTVSQCQTRLGTNYLSITSSILTPNSTSSPPLSKKLSFLQILISFIDKNISQLDLLIEHVQNQSIINCINKILMTNGLYNYPYHIKEYVLGKCLEVKKEYVEVIKNINNNKNTNNNSNNTTNNNNQNMNMNSTNNNNKKQLLQEKIENILQLQFNIINRSANIYDGIKLFQYIANINNINNIIYIYSINIVYNNKNTNTNNNNINSNSNNSNNNKQLPVPSYIQQHLSQLLLSIVHKDTNLYKTSSPTSTLQIQPKINLAQINLLIQPLILTLKQLIPTNNPQISYKKPQLKHLNIVKTLFIMIMNRQKYQILQPLIIKHSIFGLLIQLCKYHHHMDILINVIMQIFKSIFKSEVNPISIPYNNQILAMEIKNKNDQIEDRIMVQVFKSADIIMGMIKQMKSYKDPLFGQFFKLAKVIKQYSRNYLNVINDNIDMSLSMTNSMNSSLTNSIINNNNINNNINNINNNNINNKNNILTTSSTFPSILQPIYLNQFIKSKSKEWLQFYKLTFSQLQLNFMKDLGKFQQFQSIAQKQKQTQYTVTRIGQEKSLTNSQVLHDKQEYQATMKSSMEILLMDDKKKNNQFDNNNINNNINNNKEQPVLNFKKQKKNNNKINQLQSQKQQLQITNFPIKIQFKTKKISQTSNEQNDSPQQSTTTIQDSQNSFKKFMQKKMNQINAQNKQNQRKKSKTPSKFKSSQNRTSSKVKKWGTNQPEYSENQQSKQSSLKQINKGKSTSLQSQTKRNMFKQQERRQIIKNKLVKSNLQAIKIIKVSKKPKIYKQRVIELNGRDSSITQWLKVAKEIQISNN